MSQLARAATNDEKALLRTAGDWSRVYFGIYVPNVIYTARLNGAPASNDMVGSISFDGGSGTLADVRAEMTLWVGSTAGARDLGVCRIRKAAVAGTFYIGHTSDVDWVDDCYLTVVDFATLNKRPVLVSGGAVLMDGEHEFSDQHIDFDPVPVISPHAVVWLTGADVDVSFDASDSWVFDGTITGYAWTAPGCASISGNTTATPVITYDAAGHYAVWCQVTASNGKTMRAVRYVMVFDADNLPHRGELSAEPAASYDAGGWEFGVRLFENAGLDAVVDGALCIVFGEDWYGGTKQSLGPIEARENVICWGYIDGESIDWDPEAGEVEFGVLGPHAWLDKIKLNPWKLTFATNTPDSWEVMPEMTVDRALWHALHWRSNATALLSFLPNGDGRYLPYVEAMAGMLWSQLQELAWRKIFGRLGCDRYGRLWAVIDPQCTPEADRTWATVMALTERDWKERVDVRRDKTRALALLSLSGWEVDGMGGVSTRYSLSFGHLAAQHGDSDLMDEMLVANQAGANEMAGLYVGWKNHELVFDITLGQNNRMVDLWPNQFLSITLAAGDTVRGIAYDGNLVPRSISLPFDPEAGTFDVQLECEPETFAALAVDGDIPADTGVDDFDISTEPDVDFPDLPDDLGDLVFPPPSETNLNLPNKVVINSPLGVFYFDSYDEAGEPLWKAMNADLPDDDKENIRKMIVTPNGAIWILCHGAFQRIYRAAGVGGAWQLMVDGDAMTYPLIIGMGYNPFAAEQVAFALTDTGSFGVSSAEFYLANSGGYTKTADFLAGGAHLGDILFHGGNWYLCNQHGLFGNVWFYKFSGAGAILTSADITTNPGQSPATRFLSALATTLFQRDSSGAGGWNILNPSTLAATRHTDLTFSMNFQGVAFSPTGQIGLGSSTEVNTPPYKSTDGGDTWSNIGAVISTGSDIWENCGDDNRWIFGGGTTIKLTLDAGESVPIDMSGNLAYIAPLIDIQGIRFIE